MRLAIRQGEGRDNVTRIERTRRGPVLDIRCGFQATDHGHVMQIEAPLTIVSRFLRDRIEDPFRELVAVGFSPNHMEEIGGAVVPYVQATLVRDRLVDEFSANPNHGIRLPSKEFCYLSLMASLRGLQVTGGSSCMRQAACLDPVVRSLLCAVFDADGAVRGSKGLTHALPLYAPEGPWGIYARQGMTGRPALLPTHIESSRGRLMAVGRDMLVNVELGGDTLFTAKRSFIDHAVERAASGGQTLNWRPAMRFDAPIEDLAVELLRGTRPVLCVALADGKEKRITFEQFDGAHMDPVVNDGPTPKGVILQRLPEARLVQNGVLQPPRRSIRRSVAPASSHERLMSLQ